MFVREAVTQQTAAIYLYILQSLPNSGRYLWSLYSRTCLHVTVLLNCLWLMETSFTSLASMHPSQLVVCREGDSPRTVCCNVHYSDPHIRTKEWQCFIRNQLVRSLRRFRFVWKELSRGCGFYCGHEKQRALFLFPHYPKLSSEVTCQVLLCEPGYSVRCVVRVPGYRSRDLGFDSRSYQIFWEVVCLERGPLSLVSITEELLEWESRGSGCRKPRLTAVGIRCADHATPSVRKSRH
jgi:hypothetical protein